MIATLTPGARDAGIPVMVVTGDRDAYQLVGDGVRVMSHLPRRHRHQGLRPRRRDRALRRPPELVPDLIGLKGDTSDNIPGVPGIGEKTAAQLLQEFGDLETVLASVDKISGAKRKENLTNHADDARISKELATMHFDVATEVDLDEVMKGEPDLSQLREFAAEFEMRQVIQRLEDDWDESVPARRGRRADRARGRARARPPSSPRARPRSATWAAAGAASTASGRWPPSSPRRTARAALDGRPLIAHDAKSLGGGGPRGLLALARRRLVSTSATTRWSPPT